MIRSVKSYADSNAPPPPGGGEKVMACKSEQKQQAMPSVTIDGGSSVNVI